jgi:two-component system chemotaxis sensor kinase CheA
VTFPTRIAALKARVVLPPEISPFERRHLERLNRIALIFFYCHVPPFMAVAWMAGTGPLYALVSTLALAGAVHVLYRRVRNPRTMSLIYGVSAMLFGGLLVHFGQGPVQIEMHFYFFALLAMLCLYANPLVNIVAAATVALHHLVLWQCCIRSVFNYDAPWWVVLVHAAFVVLEAIAACYISREFFDNVIGLEKIIDARTARIREQQRDMRLILDNVEEGLVTIDLGGRIAGEYSKAIERWFDAPPPGARLGDWLGRIDAHFGDWFELAIESVTDGSLPVDVALAQLPVTLKDKDNDITYLVQYRLIDAGRAPVPADRERRASPRGEAAVPEKILVVILDITEHLRKEAAERHGSELLQLFRHIMRDKAGFLEFLAESDDIVKSLRDGFRQTDLAHLKRLIHTLKGNAALFGMKRLSEICHDIETFMAENRAVPADLQLSEMFSAWAKMRADLEVLLGQDARQIEIGDREYQAILRAVLDGADRMTVARMIESWRLEPTEKRLARIEKQIRGLAERMGKHRVRVVCNANGLRFDARHFAPFWSSFVHVLRNAVDHGVEDAEQRARSGKPREAVIAVTTSVEDGKFVVTVADDGPGIDWDRLRARAAALGLPSDPPERLIFAEGVSSKSEATALSGRGVGMGAVEEACKALGGTVEVVSERGVGTRIRIVFPKDEGTVYEGSPVPAVGA